MQCIIGYVSFLILCNIIVAAQTQFVSTDFLISEENVPSTFIQKNTRVFPNSTKGFIAAWEDNRDGTPSYYGQKFNQSHEPVGNNFQLLSNNVLSFINNSYFISISHQTY